jgi:hypothetical protein
VHRMRMPLDRQVPAGKSSRSSRASRTRAALLARLSPTGCAAAANGAIVAGCAAMTVQAFKRLG